MPQNTPISSPLATAQMLHRDTDELLASTQLVENLQQFGQIIIEGSYAYGTMVDEDVDLLVISPKPISLALRQQFLTTISALSGVQKISMTDRVHFPPKDNDRPLGIWVGPHFYFKNRLWNADIWLLEKDVDDSSIRQRMLRITPAQKEIIITIKHYCLAHGLKEKGATSVDIYKAVLDEGITTAAGYLQSRQA